MNAKYLEIPELDLEGQATELPTPITPYGALARTARPGGTVHFYVDDGKFSRLWHRPERILLGCYSVVVEPNFSSFSDTPRCQALHDIFKKRVLNRYWQTQGLRTLVDLNVDRRFDDITLLGVPPGWRAYAYRKQRYATWRDADELFALAAARANSSRLFFVYFGGGRPDRDGCRERGWLWVPERSDLVRGKLSYVEAH